MTTVSESRDLTLALLECVLRIRLVEERIAERYSEGKMRCPTHLSIGQEAASAGVGLALRKDDFALSTHRAHGHYIAKGGSLRRMIAEIYGKKTGCSAGKGGSMHLIDRSVGFMGSTAIVANTVPVGVGLGLSIRLHGTDQISCVFLGDAVVEEGVFFEAANFAVLKNLPVLFVCENNMYSVYSPLSVRQPAGRSIRKMVGGLGLETAFADGNDALAVYEATKTAVASIRAQQRPLFLELPTYRWREHCGPNFDNNIGYRTEDEYKEWRERDPLAVISKSVDEADLVRITTGVTAEVDDAFAFAESSPFPSPEEMFQDVYADS
jgi:TPP-dependent pyruvate/acetoin dehydrogenase alpha subunit